MPRGLMGGIGLSRRILGIHKLLPNWRLGPADQPQPPTTPQRSPRARRIAYHF